MKTVPLHPGIEDPTTRHPTELIEPKVQPYEREERILRGLFEATTSFVSKGRTDKSKLARYFIFEDLATGQHTPPRELADLHKINRKTAYDILHECSKSFGLKSPYIES